MTDRQTYLTARFEAQRVLKDWASLPSDKVLDANGLTLAQKINEKLLELREPDKDLVEELEQLTSTLEQWIDESARPFFGRLIAIRRSNNALLLRDRPNSKGRQIRIEEGLPGALRALQKGESDRVDRWLSQLEKEIFDEELNCGLRSVDDGSIYPVPSKQPNYSKQRSHAA